MKPDFPNTRFSLLFESCKSLMEPHIHAIVESSNGQRRRTSIPVVALVLLVCFLCVNLVSCAAQTMGDSNGQMPAQSLPVYRDDPSNSSAESIPSTEPSPAQTPQSAPQRTKDSSSKVQASEGESHYLVTVYSGINSGESEMDEDMIQITDETKISEIIDTLLEIEWSPKTEGNWPKYSVDRPDYSIEIQTSDRIVTINLFDTGFVAILTDDWQRYEISESHYKTLKTLLLDK